jgi:hypothetical protein
MLPPKYLCRKHLLGEHVELHMLVGSIQKKKSLSGFLRDRLIQPMAIRARHKALVKEMTERGYNHRSPLPQYTWHLSKKDLLVKVDKAENLRDLTERCEDCRQRQREYA